MAAKPDTIIEKIHFVASSSKEARAALETLRKDYGDAPPDDAEVVVALGGDGLMLQTLHSFMGRRIPIYGMNCGSVGFLMNEFRDDNLRNRLAQARPTVIHPLRMRAEMANGGIGEALAINEVSIFRLTHQAAQLRVSIDGQVRLRELICDGLLVSTPAGSTAYNFSVGGPILPINASLLALTPISPFRPRRWRGALLPSSAQVSVSVLDAEKRPMSAVADHTEIRDVLKVDVREERNIGLTLLFDPGHELDERIIAEQFRY